MESVPVYRVQLVQEPREVVMARRCVGEPKDAVEVMRSYLEMADREHIAILMLDAQNVAIGLHTVGIGTLTTAETSQREIFKAAVLANADSIILAHNHPSGNPFPSDLDMKLTMRTVDAGDLLGIEVQDHIIIGGHGSYFSMKECQIFSKLRRRSGGALAGKGT